MGIGNFNLSRRRCHSSVSRVRSALSFSRYSAVCLAKDGRMAHAHTQYRTSENAIHSANLVRCPIDSPPRARLQGVSSCKRLQSRSIRACRLHTVLGIHY